MDAEGGKLNKVFGNNRALRIPYFQRSYVWTKVEWQRFVEDIQHVALVRKPYFLGSIILKTEDVNVNGAGEQYFVVDGQQRLTTLVIFYKALYTVMAKNDEFRRRFIIEDLGLDESERRQPILVHNKFDRVIFDKICNEEPLTFSANEKSYQIAKAYTFFLNFLKRTNKDPKENLDENVDYNGLYIALRDHILLVTILLQSNENEQQIFDTINAAGRRLTTGELLKNFFFNDKNEDVYDREWSPIFDCNESLYKYWTTEITSGKTSDNNIEAFFYALMQITISDKSLGISVSGDDKKMYRHRDGGMFNNYKSLISDYKLNKEDFIKSIVSYGKIYYDSFPKDTLKEKITNDFSLQRLCNVMFASNSWTLVPYLMYIIKNVTDKKEQSRIFAFLESYLMRRLICKSSNNNYSDFFSENLIGQGKQSYADLKTYVEQKSPNDSLAMPSDEAVKQSLSEKDLSGNTARLILFMLESKTAEEKEFPSYDSFCVIPLIPKTPKNGIVSNAWPLTNGDLDSRNNHVNLLGNWCLCNTKKVTKKVIDSAWLVKKAGINDYISYAKNTNKNINSSMCWDEEFIDNRNQDLYNLILSVWKTEIAITDVESVDDRFDVELTEENVFEDDIVLTEKEKNYFEICQTNVELLNTLDESVWDLLHDKNMRQHFKRYLIDQGISIEQSQEILYQIRVFLNRIQSSVLQKEYIDIRDVDRVKYLFKKYGDIWKPQTKYPQQHIYCDEFITFIQKVKSTKVSSLRDVAVRNKYKIQITIDDETETLDPTDALERVIRKIGLDEIKKCDIKLGYQPLLVNSQFRSFRPCGQYWMNNQGSAKDKFKVIQILGIRYKFDFKTKLLK